MDIIWNRMYYLQIRIGCKHEIHQKSSISLEDSLLNTCKSYNKSKTLHDFKISEPWANTKSNKETFSHTLRYNVFIKREQLDKRPWAVFSTSLVLYRYRLLHCFTSLVAFLSRLLSQASLDNGKQQPTFSSHMTYIMYFLSDNIII